MSIQWAKRQVETPYGSVSTLHRAAVIDEAEEEADRQMLHLPPLLTPEEEAALEESEDLLGSVMWNSNIAALRYLQHQIFPSPSSSSASAPLKGLHIVELGAGVGVLGIALAMGGASVVVTDIRRLLPLMSANVALNAKAVETLSGRSGRCHAVAWDWGPSVSFNLKKMLQKGGGKKQLPLAEAMKKANPALGDSGERKAVVETMVKQSVREAVGNPSTPWLAVQSYFTAGSGATKKIHSNAGAGGVTVDYIVLCDALYGNPSDWPALLFTLSELLRVQPAVTQILNFCEQRVERVEGPFLALLQAQNDEPAWSTECDDDEASWGPLLPQLWQEQSATTAAAAAPSNAELIAQAPRLLLQRALREMRGPYVWAWETDDMEGSVSELGMPLRVTRVWWRLRDSASGSKKEDAAPEGGAKPHNRKRHREGDEE